MSNDEALQISISARDSAILARLQGELDLATGATLVDRVRPELTPGASLVLDMRGVDFVDSSGLRALITLEQAVTESGGAVSIVNPQDQLRTLLDITVLKERFQIDRSPEG